VETPSGSIGLAHHPVQVGDKVGFRRAVKHLLIALSFCFQRVLRGFQFFILLAQLFFRNVQLFQRGLQLFKRFLEQRGQGRQAVGLRAQV